jgi:hypothetical protein
MNLKDTLKKAAGLLVEFDEDTAVPATPSVDVATPVAMPAPAPQPRTVEQIVRETEGPNLDEIKVPESAQAPDPAPDGRPNFANIYKLAGLPPAPFTAEQVLELINTLPAELPIDTKRQTVKITLAAMTKTMGVTTDTIVADASRKLVALATFAESYQKQADGFATSAEAEIKSLEAQIAQKRQAIEKTREMQKHVTEVCHAESDRLDDVLEFFSLDVPPSKLAQG